MNPQRQRQMVGDPVKTKSKATSSDVHHLLNTVYKGDNPSSPPPRAAPVSKPAPPPVKTERTVDSYNRSMTKYEAPKEAPRQMYHQPAKTTYSNPPSGYSSHSTRVSHASHQPYTSSHSTSHHSSHSHSNSYHTSQYPKNYSSSTTHGVAREPSSMVGPPPPPPPPPYTAFPSSYSTHAMTSAPHSHYQSSSFFSSNTGVPAPMLGQTMGLHPTSNIMSYETLVNNLDRIVHSFTSGVCICGHRHSDHINGECQICTGKARPPPSYPSSSSTTSSGGGHSRYRLMP
ncbi:hypothetical protein GQ42DRAFT_42519 [Ramicandelaber brevisporus]|nr:hypothetical protein GQ42DRAFT_42519 [Ramicandelaber brevisporus]